jgi:hypothetical protein
VTRDQQIREALELLAPTPSQRAECRQDIGMALNWLEHHTPTARSFRVAGSKKGKGDVKRYRAALVRLRVAYYGLDPAIRLWFSLAETAYIAGKPTIIDREIVKADVFLARPSPPPRRDASRNEYAVARARDLLNWWGYEAKISRSGKWMRLAQILIGDLSLDLFDHLREVGARPGSRIEKVRTANGLLYLLRKR